MAEVLTFSDGDDNSTPWQRFERHLDLGSGFSFVFINVEDEGSAADLSQTLSLIFKRNDGALRVLNPPLLDLVYSLPELILAAPDDANHTATLVIGNGPGGGQATQSWENAWRHTVARLNERRDVLRNRLQAPLIFSGPTRLMLLLRDEAPDLWSARALVIRHEPATPRCSPQATPFQAGEDPTVALIRKTSLIELMDRFREFPQPLSPATLSKWSGRDTALALHQLHQKRLRQSAEHGDELLNEVLEAAWCAAAHRDMAEMPRLLDEIGLLLDPRRADGLTLPVSAQRDSWPQYLALDAWRHALKREWQLANHRAQEAIGAAQLFINEAKAPLSPGIMTGLSLAQEIVALSCAMTGSQQPLERKPEAVPLVSASAPDLSAPSERRQFEQGLWLLAHRRFREAERQLRAVYQQSITAYSADNSSEVPVFLKQAIIVCLLGQRRLRDAEAEATQLAACLHPARSGMRQFVHGTYVLFVVSLLCRHNATGKNLLLAALRFLEEAPEEAQLWIPFIQVLLTSAAIADGNPKLFHSTLDHLQRQTGLVSQNPKSLDRVLWALRYVPGLSAWMGYSFWASQYAEYLERTQDFNPNATGILDSLKLKAYKALSLGWRTRRRQQNGGTLMSRQTVRTADNVIDKMRRFFAISEREPFIPSKLSAGAKETRLP